MIVMGLDPGETFGIVVVDVPIDFEVGKGKVPTTGRVVVSMDMEMDLSPDKIIELARLMMEHSPRVVICEDIVPQDPNKRAPASAQIQLGQFVGMVRALAATLLPRSEFYLQVPSIKAYVGKTIISGWLEAAKWHHAKDAMIHVMYYCQKGGRENAPLPARRAKGSAPRKARGTKTRKYQSKKPKPKVRLKL